MQVGYVSCMTMPILRWVILWGCLVVPARAVDGPALPWPPTPPAAAAYARAAAIADLGRTLFSDPALSASGRMACATCHDPAHGFAAPNADPVQMGGPDLRHAGVRAVPGLTYGAFAPPFQEHAFESEDEGDESVDQGPVGGRDWDGRVDRDQAALSLLDKNEMAMADRRAVVAAVARAAYARNLTALYGWDVLTDTERAFAAVTEALQQAAGRLGRPFARGMVSPNSSWPGVSAQALTERSGGRGCCPCVMAGPGPATHDWRG
jgi:cytochrome c peroxidase